MFRRTVLAVAAAAVLAVPATAAADPLEPVKNCYQQVGWTIAALMWGEPQKPECL